MSKLESHRAGSVLHLRLNRPKLRNALNADLVFDLREALRRAENDTEVRTIVLTGTGNSFSAGADLAELEALHQASVETNLYSSRALGDLFREIQLHPKLIIARVNGHAIAGGCGLALACDISVAVSNAKVGFTEVRIGFVPALVSTLLRARASEPVVRDLLLTGRLLSTVEAQELGLLTRVVPVEDLDDTVTQITIQIQRQTSSEAIAATKRLLYVSRSMPTGPALHYLAAENALARMSPDCRAGVRAFLEKTDPPWSGQGD